MNTWFSVDETNNQFYVVEWRYGTDGQTIYNTFQPRIINVPIAPYDINSFATAMETALNGPDKYIGGQTPSAEFRPIPKPESHPWR